MKMTSFRINGRAVQRLSINGREVSLTQAPVQCDALCFTAQEPGSTVKINASNLQTSTDGRSWTPYTSDAVITLANVDDKVYFKAIGSNQYVTNYYASNGFIMTGRIAASGNVNSLLEEDEETARTVSLATKNKYCYYRLFLDCSALTQAPELPATTLNEHCYNEMFKRCSSLTQAPVLPATTLARDCYNEMFTGCTSLTQAPVLPATKMSAYCYNEMFSSCTSLTQAPVLPATKMSAYCYNLMFNGCTALTQAPELPATTLAEACYSQMFINCSNLNHVKVSFTNWDPTNATSIWLPNTVGTFECPQELINNTTERTTSTVPESWTMVAV